MAHVQATVAQATNTTGGEKVPSFAEVVTQGPLAAGYPGGDKSPWEVVKASSASERSTEVPRGADGDGKCSWFLRSCEARPYPAQFRGNHLLCLHQLELYSCSLQPKSSNVDAARVVEGRERGKQAHKDECRS